MSDQLNHNSDPETEWSNKKNLIIKQIEDKWKLEGNEKVYLFDASGPVSDLPSIKYIDYFQHFFEKYWKHFFDEYWKDIFEKYGENNIPKDIFYIYDDDDDDSDLYVGCTEETMRKVWIKVVYFNNQDRKYNMSYEKFVFSKISIGNQIFCLAKIDYLDVW